MHRRSLLTVLRGFLLGLFVLGGPGLPLVDALVWHGSGVEQLSGSRIDEQGAARIHADICSIAAPLPVPGPLPCGALPVPAAGPTERSFAPAPRVIAATRTPGHDARPRAPPAFSA